MSKYSLKGVLRKIINDIPNEEIMSGSQIRGLFSALLDYIDRLEEMQDNELFLLNTYKKDFNENGDV